MNGNRLAIITGICSIAIAFQGCSSAVPAQEKAAEPPEREITLNVTSRAGLTTEQFNSLYGNYLTEKFPNIKYNFMQQRGSKILTQDMVAAGTPIDLMFESLNSLTDGVINPGLAYDITPLIKQHNIDLNRFEPAAVESMKTMSGGPMWGLPSSMQAMVLTYNKDVFDKFGVEYPKDGMTWEQVFDLAKRLSRTDNGVQYLGLVSSTSHVLKLNPFSIPYVDGANKSTFGDPKWNMIVSTVIGGQAQQPGFAEYVINTNNRLPGMDEFLKNRNIGMWVFFTDTLFAAGADQVNLDMASVPMYKEMPGVGAQVYPNYIVISNTSTEKEAAMKVLAYLTSDEFQMILSKSGTISSLKSPDIQKALGAGFPKKVNWSAVYHNKFPLSPAKGPYEPVAEKELINLVPAITIGSTDINTALRNAREAADKAIDSQKTK